MDVGCDEATRMLHIYVDLVVADAAVTESVPARAAPLPEGDQAA
jgi:hypothetical protein